MSDRKLKPMTWDEGRYPCYSGKVGGLTVATVSYTTVRDDPYPWKLTVELFNSRRSLAFKDRDIAKAAAPRALAEMLERLYEPADAP